MTSLKLFILLANLKDHTIIWLLPINRKLIIIINKLAKKIPNLSKTWWIKNIEKLNVDIIIINKDSLNDSVSIFEKNKSNHVLSDIFSFDIIYSEKSS